MNFDKLWEYNREAVMALASGWELKAGISGIITILQLQGELFLLFNLLVILDLMTKWLALTRPLCDCDQPNVWHEFKKIPEAHRRGIISSDEMKTRFLGKILVYIATALASGMVDIILKDFGRPPLLMELCIGYLAATELLSVIENLDEAGVSAMSDLAAMVKKVRGKS